MNLIKEITNLQNKPMNNKILRKAFKVLYPYGTMPKKVFELKEFILSWVARETFPDHLKDKKKPFIDCLTLEVKTLKKINLKKSMT